MRSVWLLAPPPSFSFFVLKNPHYTHHRLRTFLFSVTRSGFDDKPIMCFYKHRKRAGVPNPMVAHYRVHRTSRHAHLVVMSVVEEVEVPGIVRSWNTQVVVICTCGGLGGRPYVDKHSVASWSPLYWSSSVCVRRYCRRVAYTGASNGSPPRPIAIALPKLT